MKVNKVYGRWVQQLSEALDAEELDPDTLHLLVSGEPILLSKEEAQKYMNQAFRATLHDHPTQVDMGWAGSLFKRFWGRLKQAQRDKLQTLRDKQQDHLDYIEKQGKNNE